MGATTAVENYVEHENLMRVSSTTPPQAVASSIIPGDLRPEP